MIDSVELRLDTVGFAILHGYMKPRLVRGRNRHDRTPGYEHAGQLWCL